MVSVKRSEQSEVELKFECDPADAEAIEAHSALAGVDPVTRTLVSIYFDTDERALRKGGVALRVRDTGERYVQTIKSLDGTGALFERAEWEQEIEGRSPDLDAAAKTALEPLLDAEVRKALQPVFETRVARTLYRVGSNGSDIEVALDRGEIAAAKGQSPVCELELELKRGDRAELFRLARVIAATVPLRLGVKSKAERGFELADGKVHAFEKAETADLDKGLSAREAFRAIAHSCLRQIVANACPVCVGNAEGVHQMRVGLRRLRAAIVAFAEVTADRRQDKIVDQLKWITKKLGPARDLDVFAADVLRKLQAGHADDQVLADAQRAFTEMREHAYAEATEAIGSDQFRTMLLDVAEWIEVGPWTTGKKLRGLRMRPVREHAAKELARQRKRVRKRGKQLRELAPRKRHRLRIKAKNLRYATEFFASIFPGAKSRRRRRAALSALKDLQNSLGALNDLVARDTLMAGGDASQAQALRSLAWGEVQAEALLEEAEAAYERFAAVKRFWR